LRWVERRASTIKAVATVVRRLRTTGNLVAHQLPTPLRATTLLGWPTTASIAASTASTTPLRSVATTVTFFETSTFFLRLARRSSVNSTTDVEDPVKPLTEAYPMSRCV